MEKGITELSPPKCAEEAGKINDLKYCWHHRVISHPLEKCIMLKKRVMQLANDGTIILDLDEAAETNNTIIWCEHCDLTHPIREELVIIQFGSVEQ